MSILGSQLAKVRARLVRPPIRMADSVHVVSQKASQTVRVP